MVQEKIADLSLGADSAKPKFIKKGKPKTNNML